MRTYRRRVSGAAEFQRARYPIIAAPFHGAAVLVKVRMLTQAQILSCGDFSLIETFADSVAKREANLTTERLLQYAEKTHAIAQLALVAPTYDEILSFFGGDSKIAEARERLGELRKILEEVPEEEETLGERRELGERIDALTIWADLILPEDFLAFVTNHAIGIDRSGIKQVSEEMLVDAAVLAEKGHDNPCDHLHGTWDELPTAEFFHDDINKRAWLLLAETRKEPHA